MEDDKIFTLKGKYDLRTFHYLKPPPPIKGKTDHGIKYELTFFFDTKEEMEEVREFFKEGKSRIPDGKKLLSIVRSLKGGEKNDR